MKHRRHVIAAIICVAIALCLFVSSAYLVHETAHRHACSGENCPICQFIAQVEQLRRGFSMALLALLVICFSLAVGHPRHAGATAEDRYALCTLVGRNIRLND